MHTCQAYWHTRSTLLRWVEYAQASLEEHDVETGLGHQDSAMAIQAAKADDSTEAHDIDSKEGRVTQ